MGVYLINIVLILFWRLYFTHKRLPDARKYYCAIVAIQWILISGLRHWSVGADTKQYYNLFESVKDTSWEMLLRGLLERLFGPMKEYDIGYYILTKLFQIFSGSYQLFLLAIAVFFISLMAVWIYRYSSSPCTSFILFSTLFYSFYALTGHRQTIATALVCFVGYGLILQRKFWKFVAVVFMAFLIHKSSLLFLPLYFLCQIPITLGYRIFCTIVIMVVGILGRSLYVPIALWMGFDEVLINYAEGGAELYAVLLILLCTIIWILYPRIAHHRQDARVLFHINSLTVLTGLMVFHNQSFMRIQQYFSLYLMITIPEVINTVKREYRLLVYLLFGGVMIVYLIHNNPQYQFFFMN